MLGGFGLVRVPLLLLTAASFGVVSTLLVRVIHQFYFVNAAQDLLPLVGYSSVTSLTGFAIITALYTSTIIFYGVTDGENIPVAAIFCLGLVVVITFSAKYTLFTIRLHGSFQNSAFVLEPSELYTILSGLIVIILSAVLSFSLWRRNQPNSHPQKISSAVFVFIAALSQLSLSLYFIWLFVSRLRKLLHKSTSLKTKSKEGRAVQASQALHEKMRSVSEDDRNDELGSDLGKEPRPSSLSSTSPKEMIYELTGFEALKPASTEENVVKEVIEDSEIEDKTMVVVMVRYTLLKIVAVVSSLITLSVGALIILISFDTSVDIHETEIFIIFGSIDALVNVHCLFFTFYSFGFSIFQYSLCCGRAESVLMHCFEERIKNDFFEQLLREAQTTLRDDSTLRFAKTMTLRDLTDPKAESSVGRVKRRHKGLMRSITPSSSKSGISLALI